MTSFFFFFKLQNKTKNTGSIIMRLMISYCQVKDEKKVFVDRGQMSSLQPHWWLKGCVHCSDRVPLRKRYFAKFLESLYAEEAKVVPATLTWPDCSAEILLTHVISVWHDNAFADDKTPLQRIADFRDQNPTAPFPSSHLYLLLPPENTFYILQNSVYHPARQLASRQHAKNSA